VDTLAHLQSKSVIRHFLCIGLAVMSAKCKISSLSTVSDAAIAVADERLVISCARSLNRLSGGSLQIFQLLLFFYYLTYSVYFSFSYFFSYSYSYLDHYFSVFLLFQLQLQLTVITLQGRGCIISPVGPGHCRPITQRRGCIISPVGPGLCTRITQRRGCIISPVGPGLCRPICHFPPRKIYFHSIRINE